MNLRTGWHIKWKPQGNVTHHSFYAPSAYKLLRIGKVDKRMIPKDLINCIHLLRPSNISTVQETFWRPPGRIGNRSEGSFFNKPVQCHLFCSSLQAIPSKQLPKIKQLHKFEGRKHCADPPNTNHTNRGVQKLQQRPRWPYSKNKKYVLISETMTGLIDTHLVKNGAWRNINIWTFTEK